MLTKLWSALSGYKTYILSGAGVMVVLIGHFFGPTTVAGVQIPQMDWPTSWRTLWFSGLFAALRNGINRT